MKKAQLFGAAARRRGIHSRRVAVMALGRRRTSQQGELFLTSADLPQSPGHAFYDRLNELLAEADFGTNVDLDVKLLKSDGDIVVYGSNAPQIAVPFVPMILKNVRLRFFIVYNLSPEDRARAIADLNELLAANRLEHNIAVRLPLEKIAEAHELVEQGVAVGKVLLDIG